MDAFEYTRFHIFTSSIVAEKVLSLDIQRVLDPEIDLSGFFPLASVHAMST